tara:strand:+ start:5418 stop:5639 length:222 start_codon:yes stop_codon:yes gene_type:complete
MTNIEQLRKELRAEEQKIARENALPKTKNRDLGAISHPPKEGLVNTPPQTMSEIPNVISLPSKKRKQQHENRW